MGDSEAEPILRQAARTAQMKRVETGLNATIPPAHRIIDDAQIKRRDAEDEDRQKEAKTRRLLERAGIPARWSAADFDDVPGMRTILGDTEFERYASVALRLERANLCTGPIVLCGARGGGKTHLACALVRRFCAIGRSASYATTGQFLLALTSTFDGDGKERDVFRRFIAPDLLVLDEFQERTGGQWDTLKLTQLIDHRYGAMTPTLIVSNLTRAEFVRLAGVSVADRANDGGMVLECDWPSLRGRITR